MGYFEAIVAGVLLLVIVASIAIVRRSPKEISKKSRKIKEYARSIPDLTITKKVVNLRRSSAIVLDLEHEGICLIWLEGDEYMHKRYSFGDILACEIVEDGVPIHSVNYLRESSAVDTSVRSFGLNAVRGSSRFLKEIQNIKLRMVVDDLERPSHSVTIGGLGIERGSFEHRRTIERGRKWLDVIAVARRRLITEESGIRSTTNSKVLE